MLIAAAVSAPWGASSALDVGVMAATVASDSVNVPVAAPWEIPTPLDVEQSAPWGIAAATDHASAAVWGQFARLDADAVSPWDIATATDRAAESPWGQYLNRPQRDLVMPWGISTATDRAADSPWGQYTARLAIATAVPWGISVRTDINLPSPWGKYQQRLALVVEMPTEAGGGTQIIPIQRTYIVINNATLKRVSDNLELPATSINLSIDAETWTWGFNANLPASALDDVIGTAGAPVELAAWINGTEFRVIVERVTRSRVFAKADIQISGRGVSALFDAPYAAPYSLYSADAITAQQAAEAAIGLPDLPTGWTIDWQLTDWLLPAGLWSHQGTPISALNRIATAAGGYIQTHNKDPILHVKSRYPLAPWDWSTATPDYEIPSSIATTEAIEWTDRPDYDVVYVSGEVGGVLGRVLRTGEAGIRPAQMVTDNLITHADAARQRGRSILANTGRQALVTLSMPVLNDVGIMLPGNMVEYTDGSTTRIGLTRGVSIQSAGHIVRQSVEIETHE